MLTLISRILTIEEARQLTIEELLSLRERGIYPPIAGGDGEGDGDSDDGGGGGTEASGESAGTPAGGSSQSDGVDDAVEDGDSDEDILEIKRGDYNHYRKVARQHEAAEKQRAKDERKRKEENARAAGQYEELVKEKETEVVEARAEAEAAKMELYNERKTARVGRVATRLGFKDPEDALHNITDEDAEDDASTERALKSLAKKKPYLVESRRPTGVPIGAGNGGGGDVLLTYEQVQNMSEDEINANWNAVQKALQGGPN